VKSWCRTTYWSRDSEDACTKHAYVENLSPCEFRKPKENPKKCDWLVKLRVSCNGFRPLRVLYDSGALKSFV